MSAKQETFQSWLGYSAIDITIDIAISFDSYSNIFREYIDGG